MAKFMSQELFDMSAVTAAQIAAVTDHSIQSAARLIGRQYNSSLDDINLNIEIADAAGQISSFLKNRISTGNIAPACSQLQFSIKSFNLDGTKKRKKIFGGLFFNSEKKQIGNKVENCVKNIISYHSLVVVGALPLAPSGWTLSA